VNLSPPRTLPLFADLPLPQAGGTGLGAGLAGRRGQPLVDTFAEPAEAAEPAEPAAWLPTPEQALPHPSLWRASQLGGSTLRVTASGFAVLDAELPGGGWPHGALTELLLPQPGIGELRLLAPALAAIGQGLQPQALPGGAAEDGRCVMLFDPPAALSAWALAQCGLDSRHWLVVQARAGQGSAGTAARPLADGPATAAGQPRGANRLAPLLPAADLLWALEQALKSGHVGAVLAWLPVNLRADALRRLQLAAQAHDGPVFLFRDALARNRPSAAPLRLLLQPAGVGGLSLRLLKRRGPLLAQPLRLALPAVLAPQLQAQAEARQLTVRLARPPLGQGARAGPRSAQHVA